MIMPDGIATLFRPMRTSLRGLLESPPDCLMYGIPATPRAHHDTGPRPDRNLRQQPGPDGGRADLPRRAGVRHLLASAEAADHLSDRPRLRPGGLADLRPVAVPGVG